MKFLKKAWKEVSVFGLVFVVFLGLYAYRQATHVELSTISQEKLEEKLENKDSFVVVLGSDSDTNTLSYKETLVSYMENNRGDNIYYCDLLESDDPVAYIQDTFNTNDGTYPTTFVIEDGVMTKQKSGNLSYYRISELFE